MSLAACGIADALSADLFVIWSEGNSEKTIIRCRSLTRHGIVRNDTGALVRSSLEETVEILAEAA